MKHRYKTNPITWGFLLGTFCAIALETGIFETWHPLGKPPEEISQIIGANGANVYVQTSSGNTYRYDFSNSNDESSPKVWEIETSHDYLLNPQNKNSGYFITIPPLFWVKQSFSIDDYGTIESSGIRRFVIDQNDSMWMWRHFSAGMGIIILPIFPVAGIVLGAFIAFVW